MLGLPDSTVGFAVTEAYFPTDNITKDVLLDSLHINRGVINARCPEDYYNHKGHAVGEANTDLRGKQKTGLVQLNAKGEHGVGFDGEQ